MQRIFFFCFVALFSVGTAWADFAVVVLPDTQNYSENYPEIFDAQTQWTVDNKAARNIQFLSHVGDLVQNAANIPEWQNADHSMSILDGIVPYGTCLGNHDILYPGDFTDFDGVNYRMFFDPSRYASEPWFGGASPSGLSNYQIINVDGQDYLFLHLLIETPAAELSWAQGILNANQDKPTWVSTHRYLYDWTLDGAFPFIGAGRYDDFNYFFEPPYRPDGIKSDDFFNNFIAANKQIYMVYCGHNHSEYHQSSTNNFGLTVHELLADFQDDPNGGNGWLRINTFRPTQNRIDVETYSPTLNQFRTDADSLFSVNVPFDQYKTVQGEAVLSFQQGVTSYSGTQDTWISEDDRNTQYGGSSVIVVDNDVNNCPGIFCTNELEGQGLVKFDNIFQGPVYEGDPAPTHIPTNANISSASMNITLGDDVDSPTCGGLDFRIYRMTRDWDESSTWNSLSGGINVGSETTGQIASFPGDNSPNSDFGRTVGVTSSVNAWKNGAANYGFAILSEDISGCDDGIDIKSSENGETTNRPKLTVQFTYDVLNAGPIITQGLTATPSTVMEGSEADLSISAQDPNSFDPLTFRIDGQDVGFATGTGTVVHPVLFEDEGSYTFSAQVLDDETSVGAGSVTVTVLNADPVIMSMSQNRTVDVGRPFVFNSSAVDPGILDVLSYNWDLDGNSQYDNYTGESGIHWFLSKGAKTVAVQVADEDGGSTTGQFTVTVVDVPADGDFDGDGIGVDTGNNIFLDGDDQAALAVCKSGSNVTPVPPAGFVVENCLSAFDADNDGDVDDTDELLILNLPLPQPPAAVPAATPAVLMIAAAMLVAVTLQHRRNM